MSFHSGSIAFNVGEYGGMKISRCVQDSKGKIRCGRVSTAANLQKKGELNGQVIREMS